MLGCCDFIEVITAFEIIVFEIRTRFNLHNVLIKKKKNIYLA